MEADPAEHSAAEPAGDRQQQQQHNKIMMFMDHWHLLMRVAAGFCGAVMLPEPDIIL